MKLTVISHFYNEEYLLPWWLKFHREIFDHGIMINHASTDKSREIIADLCPSWRVVDTELEWFDPNGTDAEVNRYEREAPEWKVALNTTEFLCGYVSQAIFHARGKGLRPRAVALVDSLEESKVAPSHHMPIHKQRNYGIISGHEAENRRRLIHCYPSAQYRAGRHVWANDSDDTDQVMIVALLMSPMNEQFIARKLQIQNRIVTHQPTPNGQGDHHYVSRDGLMNRWWDLREQSVFLPACEEWRNLTRCYC